MSSAAIPGTGLNRAEWSVAFDIACRSGNPQRMRRSARRVAEVLVDAMPLTRTPTRRQRRRMVDACTDVVSMFLARFDWPKYDPTGHTTAMVQVVAKNLHQRGWLADPAEPSTERTLLRLSERLQSGFCETPGILLGGARIPDFHLPEIPTSYCWLSFDVIDAIDEHASARRARQHARQEAFFCALSGTFFSLTGAILFGQHLMHHGLESLLATPLVPHSEAIMHGAALCASAAGWVGYLVRARHWRKIGDAAAARVDQWARTRRERLSAMEAAVTNEQGESDKGDALDVLARRAEALGRLWVQETTRPRKPASKAA